MDIVASHEKRSKSFWAITGIVFIAGVGVVDYLSGHEIVFSLFYLFPVALITWYMGRRSGVVAAVVCALVWLIVDFESGHRFSHIALAYWNSLIRFSFFVLILWLVSALKNALERESALARFDYLTGAANARFFSELVQIEIDRLQRNERPFTLAYIDLDNFKTVNDRFGHSMGDKILAATVKHARGQLRKIDVIARLGGDEFAILLPETDPAAAQVAFSKLHASLSDEMRRNNWPVAFSIGVLTCMSIPQTIDDLIKQADDLMYSVKQNGKNSIHYAVYGI